MGEAGAFLRSNGASKRDSEKLEWIVGQLIENHAQYHPGSIGSLKSDYDTAMPATICITLDPQSPKKIMVRSEGYISPTQFEELGHKIEYTHRHSDNLAGLDIMDEELDTLPHSTSWGCHVGTVAIARQARSVPRLTKCGEASCEGEEFPFALDVQYNAHNKFTLKGAKVKDNSGAYLGP